MVPIPFAFEASQESWDVLLNFLKIIANLHLFGSTGLVKCQDVSLALESLLAFSDRDSANVCNLLFSQG